MMKGLQAGTEVEMVGMLLTDLLAFSDLLSFLSYSSLGSLTQGRAGSFHINHNQKRKKPLFVHKPS